MLPVWSARAAAVTTEPSRESQCGGISAISSYGIYGVPAGVAGGSTSMTQEPGSVASWMRRRTFSATCRAWATVMAATLTIVSRVHRRVRAASAWPAHRSTTGWLSMVTATAAPTSPCAAKFSANASRTGRRRASQRPSMAPLTTRPGLGGTGRLQIGGQRTTPGNGSFAFAIGQGATGGLDEEALDPDHRVALATQALADLGGGRPGEPPGFGIAGVEGRGRRP